MYYRAMRIGDKAVGRDALEAQKQCYLDVVTCLSLIQPELCRHVIKKTGIIRQPKENVVCFDKNGTISVPLFSTEQEIMVIDSKNIEKELAVLSMLSKMGDCKRPVKPTDFVRRASKTVDELALSHRYDDALKLASIWDIDASPVISYFTDVCCNLVYNIMPEDGDPGLYILWNDVTGEGDRRSKFAFVVLPLLLYLAELPTTETGYAEIAFRLLQNYLNKHEKDKESTLHQVATLKLLAADIELPQWLLASYKVI